MKRKRFRAVSHSGKGPRGMGKGNWRPPSIQGPVAPLAPVLSPTHSGKYSVPSPAGPTQAPSLSEGPAR